MTLITRQNDSYLKWNTRIGSTLTNKRYFMYTAPTSENETYPGIFHPATGIEEQIEKANRKFKSPKHFRAELTESDDIYTIKLHTGDLDKKSLIVYTTSSGLVIYGRKHHTRSQRSELEKYRIELPSDADTDFITSEFRNGLLTFYLTKKPNFMKNYSDRLIVY